MMITATLIAKRKPNDRHWYAYNVLVDGAIIVSDSRDPEHDLARALLARGIKGWVTVHDGETGKARTVVDIKRAALWCVGSNLVKYRWKAPEASNYSAGGCSIKRCLAIRLMRSSWRYSSTSPAEPKP